MTGHPVWFEREALPEVIAQFAGRCLVLGPGEKTPDDPYGALPSARGIVAGAYDYGADVMDLAPELRVIARTGIGVDKVDVAAATARGIAVCNAPDGPTVPTAEHALALLLAMAKHLKAAEDSLRGAKPGFFTRHHSVELDGKTLGLVGYGRIARRVGRMAAAIGMRIAAYDPYLPEGPLDGADRYDDLDEMLSVADAVSIHIPLTDESRRLFDAARLARMKPGAILVNTARGGIVDLEALAAALDEGRLVGAGLDVTEPEPLPPQHPLLARTDVIVTPHIASATVEGKRRMFETAISQVLQVLDGVRPPHLVNPEVWDRVAAEVSS